MNPLSRLCPKCGSDKVRAQYEHAHAFSQEDIEHGRAEWLIMTCECDYSWEQPCMDAKVYHDKPV